MIRSAVVVTVLVLFGFLRAAKAQEIFIDALHGQQAMSAAAANDGQRAKNEGRGVPILRDADETAWVGNLEYYHPQPGFDRANRDIDVENVRISRAWHFPVGWEFHVSGLFFRASGTRTTDAPPPATERSDALGFGLSPAVRWNFLDFRRARFLGDLSPGINFTNKAFPAGGTNYGFFLRAGAGASFRLSARYWVEVAYYWTHISNLQGIGSGNPTWRGEGLTLGLRRANRAEPSSAMAGGKRLSERPSAKENGWLTEGEYLVRDSGSNAVGSRSGLQLYRVARAWHFTNGLELQFGGLIFPNPGASGLGPQLRWNFLNRERWHLFVRGEPDFIKTGFFFVPLGGDQYNFLFQAGGGASYRLHSSYCWKETTLRDTRWMDGTASLRILPGAAKELRSASGAPSGELTPKTYVAQQFSD